MSLVVYSTLHRQRDLRVVLRHDAHDGAVRRRPGRRCVLGSRTSGRLGPPARPARGPRASTLSPGLTVGQRLAQVVDAVDLVAVRLHDHVAGHDAGRRGRRVGDDLRHAGAVLRRPSTSLPSARMATAAATFCDWLMSAASSAARCCGVWPFGSTTSSEHELRAALAQAREPRLEQRRLAPHDGHEEDAGLVRPRVLGLAPRPRSRAPTSCAGSGRYRNSSDSVRLA